MDLTSKRSKQFRVKTRGATLQMIETQESKDALDSTQHIDLTACPHGLVLHNIEEIKAVCGVCGAPLCETCSRRVCDLQDCGQTVCVDHGNQHGDSLVCSSHRLSEILSGRSRNGSRSS